MSLPSFVDVFSTSSPVRIPLSKKSLNQPEDEKIGLPRENRNCSEYAGGNAQDYQENHGLK